MISEKLKAARAYESENSKKIPETDRPLYHVTGGVGWINDPNGFSMYKGEYHLFFQYHPFSTKWGPMHWGHVKTKDFVTWERLPIALAPDTVSDGAGCFSGSALELSDGRMLLAYTGVERKKDAEGIEREYQQQCIAVGDGIDFEKASNNPVIAKELLPEGFSAHDFRDPKIWQENGMYYLAAANRASDGSGAILLYKSTDYLHWSFAGIIDQCRNEYGRMWECPDCFLLDGKRILMTSPQEMLSDGAEFHAGNGTVFLYGEGEQWEAFKRTGIQSIDYGIDFYAPQTLLASDGRRIMIAWMQNWATSDYANEERKFFGEMTLPRVLEMKNGKIIQNPVKEIADYYGEKTEYHNVSLKGEMELAGISGRVLDMTVTAKSAFENSFTFFKMRLAKSKQMDTMISYDARTKTVRIDRSRSGVRADIVNMREFFVTSESGRIKFRILMDRHSVELFVNDGEQAATMMLYTPVEAQDIVFETDGEVILDVEKYDLEEKLCRKNMM